MLQCCLVIFYCVNWSYYLEGGGGTSTTNDSNSPSPKLNMEKSLSSPLSSYNVLVPPTDCQIAKLKPLFKKGSTTHPKNYRPISLLPLISKIIEKVIHDQTQEFLDTNKILFKFQSGFRKGYSTDSCLSNFSNLRLI